MSQTNTQEIFTKVEKIMANEATKITSSKKNQRPIVKLDSWNISQYTLITYPIIIRWGEKVIKADTNALIVGAYEILLKGKKCYSFSFDDIHYFVIVKKDNSGILYTYLPNGKFSKRSITRIDYAAPAKKSPVDLVAPAKKSPVDQMLPMHVFGYVPPTNAPADRQPSPFGFMLTDLQHKKNDAPELLPPLDLMLPNIQHKKNDAPTYVNPRFARESPVISPGIKMHEIPLTSEIESIFAHDYSCLDHSAILMASTDLELGENQFIGYHSADKTRYKCVVAVGEDKDIMFIHVKSGNKFNIEVSFKEETHHFSVGDVINSSPLTNNNIKKVHQGNNIPQFVRRLVYHYTSPR